VRLRRDRFAELVRRQLDLFESDEAELLGEIDEAERAWNRAGRDEAEEAYGDYQLAVDAASDILLDIRESYAATLVEPQDDEYRTAFTRAASRRFPRLSTLLADLDE
jgi:hypothetical protein